MGPCGNHDFAIICAERYGWTETQTLTENSRGFTWELSARWEAEARVDKETRKKRPRAVAGGNLVSEDVDMSAIPWADEG